MITLYHGTRRTELPRHAGLCLAETALIARDYAGEDGLVYRVTVDDDLLSWVHLGDWDRDEAVAPGDSAAGRAAIVAEHDVCACWYRDESPFNRAHDTLRLLTTDALDAIVAVEVMI